MERATTPTKIDANRLQKRKEFSLKKSPFRASRIDLADHSELPTSYHSTYLTLIARDPYWIYAYWEITPSSLEEIKNKIGSRIKEAVFVIRMYDVTYIYFDGTNANRSFDIEIEPGAGNWYINLWSDNATYCADLGLRLPEGSFFALARSNFVTTPRFYPSGRSDQIWMEVKENKASRFVMARVEQRKATRSPSQGHPLSSKRLKRINLSEDDVRAYYLRLSPLLRDIISRRLPRLKNLRKTRPTQISLYNQGPLNPLPPRQILQKIRRGASEELVGGASESLFSGASLQDHKGITTPKQFFFELGIELIVYGRTEPTAAVWWGEKKIKLQSDGTFRMQFVLPEGKVPLDFKALSHDGTQERQISTQVERTKTFYNP